jgi:crotonobetainyl-CoA:carnitine CoA-transferase CaiB-like acyl-CoA transferase
VAAPVPRLSETPGHIERAGGEIGDDTRQVLRDYLAMSEAEIEALRASGAIACGS